MAGVATVYRNVRSLRTAIKDAGRMRQIATVLARHGFGHVVQRLELPAPFGIGQAAPSEEDTDLPYTFARRIRLACEELGPTFVKLGQILSTRSDLLGPDTIKELESLQDSAPPMAWDDVEHQIVKHLGDAPHRVFDAFEREPLARASIAQVHRAMLPDGIEVVVKVRRRGIAETLRRDLSIMYFLAERAEEFIPELALVEPSGIVEQFDRALSKELDFANERRNIERFRENFADFRGIYIPQVYRRYCAAGVLTMELIPGTKITDAVDVLDVDPYLLAPRMLRALLKMVFQDGFFHGDLHPGNVLITEDHTIALLDFGLVGRLLPRQRDEILQLLSGLAREDYELVARTLFDLGVKVPGVHYNYLAFEADVCELMERLLAGRTLEDVNVQQLFSELVNGAIRHQLKLPPTYTLVFKALMTVEGIGRALAPNINLLAEARPFLRDMIAARYSPDRIWHDAVDAMTSTSRFFRLFTQTAPRLLQDMEQGRFAVHMESEALDRLAVEQARGSVRQARAMVAAASFVVAALVHDVPGPGVWGLHVAALGAAALGGVALLPVLRDMIWPPK